MPATNYKPDKPLTCVRCGKAIVQTKHGRRLYCYKCREEMQQANQHNYWVRKREANPKVPKKNCHINWQIGDKLILNGAVGIIQEGEKTASRFNSGRI